MYNPKDVFTDEEIKKIQLFGISIANNMIPLEYKDHYMTAKGQMWDIDTYIYGVCKCLTMREDDFLCYYESTLYNSNTMCSNLEIFFKLVYEYKVKSFLELKNLDQSFDSLLVCEAGRGIDVLLAVLARGEQPWKRIEAYDLDKSVLFEMKKYFCGEMKLPFYPLQISTYNYQFSSINCRTVVFGTCHNLTEDIKDQIRGNKNLIGVLDGEVISKN